jgi:hypothetical protein
MAAGPAGLGAYQQQFAGLSTPPGLLIQKAEVDWAFAPDKRPPFKKDRQMPHLAKCRLMTRSGQKRQTAINTFAS